VRDSLIPRRSAAYEAMRTRQRVLINDDVVAHIGLIDVCIAHGRPSSLLYQPLLLGDTPLNDTYGHPAGDRLLKETAAAWRGQLRPGDVLARVGGEEFGLLLLDCDAHTASEVVDRLREQVTHDRTCSAGIAIKAVDESPDDAVQRADTALYQAKAQGRDQSRLAANEDLAAAPPSAHNRTR
jgi:predicted signal transduction protein with EAL and GGDEF domain